MPDSAILVLRAARQEYLAWIARLQESPDPIQMTPQAVRQLRDIVQQAGLALVQKSPENVASKEWETEVREYGEALRLLHEKLQHFGISLRVRRAQMARTRAHQHAVRSWVELTKKLR